MVFTFVLGLLSQHLLRALMGWLVSSGIGFTRTLVVAGVENCQSILERMRFAHGSIHQVAGLICAGDDLPGEISGVPVLGRVKDFSRLIDRLKDIDRVVVALPVEQHEKSWEILESCRRRRIDCRFVPELFDLLSLQVDVSAIDGLPSITLGETPLTGAGPVLKRLMDMTVASIGLVVASPVMILFALLIKLDSKGPALFKQQRLGSDGRVFDMYKFRTMHIGAEALTGPVWATNNDPRCTRVGRWLRRTNLDELPQILNVLRGEMSLVGPRPERAYFVNKFKTSVPQYMRRHLVKSGITGWAQVNGLRGNTPVEERVRYDIFYIENWSLLFDLKIMFRTLFSTKNAY
jgi:exopolysaccharide biosynthesis polyprenyl glycosylphosphotransferase